MFGKGRFAPEWPGRHLLRLACLETPGMGGSLANDATPEVDEPGLHRNHFLGLDGRFMESGPTFVESIPVEATTHDHRICPRTGFDPLAGLRHLAFQRTDLVAKRALFPGLPPGGQKPG